jgi:hypothetical protein
MSEELCDFGNVPDTFCSGLANIENIGGGCLRLNFYVMGTNDPRRPLERICVANLRRQDDNPGKRAS